MKIIKCFEPNCNKKAFGLRGGKPLCQKHVGLRVERLKTKKELKFSK